MRGRGSTGSSAGTSSELPQHLLHSGHVDRGLQILRSRREEVGLPFPDPFGRLPIKFLLARARARLLRSPWRGESLSKTKPHDLLRVDACASAATGLALVDIARGAMLQTNHLLLARKAGEPTRLIRALAMEAGYLSTGGVRNESEGQASDSIVFRSGGKDWGSPFDRDLFDDAGGLRVERGPVARVPQSCYRGC